MDPRAAHAGPARRPPCPRPRRPPPLRRLPGRPWRATGRTGRARSPARRPPPPRRGRPAAAAPPPDRLHEARPLLAQDPLHAADRVALAVQEVADAAEEIDVVRPVVAAAAAALHRADLGEAAFPEAQHVLRHVEIVSDFADGAEGI